MLEGVSIIVPTWNGGEIFRKSLDAIKQQKYEGNLELIVIDSGSTDGTLEEAENAGANVIQIAQKDFHHSRTRNLAVSHAKYDKVVLLVQDAIPETYEWLIHLVNAIENQDVVAAYGKQIPHTDADLYARFEVEYHSEYLGMKPNIQSIVSKEDFMKMSYDEALRNVRFDNVCSIYKKELFLELPFPDIPFGEDMAWAKEAILRGHKVIYDPNIKVRHSHNRSPNYRFKRAIVDTIACAEILERIKTDMSFIKEADLLHISQSVEERKMKILNELKASSNDSVAITIGNNVLKQVVKKFPVFKRLFWSLLSEMGKGNFSNNWIKAFSHAAEQHMRFVLNQLEKRYPNATLDEMVLGLEQVSASLLGGVFGEVMASYKQKGTVPDEINKLITPFLKGV